MSETEALLEAAIRWVKANYPGRKPVKVSIKIDDVKGRVHLWVPVETYIRVLTGKETGKG